MTKFVIQCVDTGKYVADLSKSEVESSIKSSYTKVLEKARVYYSLASAERECCGNERIINLNDLVR